MSVENFWVYEGDLSAETLARYLEAPAIAVDTETMGLVPGRDRLCLVQLCDPAGFASAVRVRRGHRDAPNLKRLMEEPGVEKVFHYARFDVAQLSYTFGIHTRPLFCTKIASKLARTYTSNHGLKTLVQELEGIELDKTSQSSDWGNVGELTTEQLSYAANDVRYLLGAREKLIRMLQREERWELARKCFACIPVFTELDLAQYKDIFEH